MERIKLKGIAAIIVASFLIIAIVTPVNAANPNRTLMIDIMAKGDDLDIPETSNFFMAKIKSDKVSGMPLVRAEFQSKIYESGKKVYEMKGKLKDGLLLTTDFYFYCPIFNVWFINVWQVMGVGLVKTTDTNFPVFFRNSFPITLPNTGGKYISAPILMLLSPTAEFCLKDPVTNTPGSPENPVEILEQGGWVLAAVIWYVGIPMDVGFGFGMFPVGPISYLTKWMEK